MGEKLSILLCEDDENLGMLLREYLQIKTIMKYHLIRVKMAIILKNLQSYKC